ncbi:DUF6497 family protein [Aliiroseovarius sp. F20344]|uniref:DUF6497 family protein n=1 Tax=Aliiroseovarius sp. F20344 TaxID=2926414 RepID=UPI001FF66AA3|nr:DUF6497 family protein [Aliiroseovarius sp. F20344]MCK0142202.1 DUF6497 family protein [Aliiroseovarius sp. F20344]
MGRTVGYQGLHGLIGVAVCAAILIPIVPSSGISKDVGWDPEYEIEVPSGQEITFLEIIRGEDSAVGTAIRYRFLAPAIGRPHQMVEFSQAEEDMSVICQDYILPRIDEVSDELPDQIIVVLSDRPVEHGVMAPEATQFFEAYRPVDGECVWEGF